MAVNPSTFGPCPQFVNAAGDPAVGDKLFFYAAGTTTKQNTYTNSTGSVANTNPIVLDALGEPSAEIWFTNGEVYKMVWAPSTDTDPPTNPIRTFDNLRGIGDTTASAANSEWILSASVPTYVNATSFTIPGNQTATFTQGRRMKTTNTSGTVYSTILTSVYGVLTTITVLNDSGVLDSGLSDVSYGILSTTNPSVPNSQTFRQTMGIGYGSDIASAATLPLSTVTGEIVRVTGTVTTTDLTMTNGQRVKCLAVGAWPLTYHATNLPLPGATNYTCSAGDMVIFTKNGNSDLTIEIVKKDGTAVSSSQIQGISASVGSNALTISSGSLSLEFRSTTLGSGTITKVNGTPSSLVISSGSTLGTTSAVQSDIAVLAINNAGSLELAAVNMIGGNDLSESGLISTTAEGGAGTADSANVIYSNTARTNVAYRVLGIVRSTQATPGTWATAPSTIQGMGGNAYDIIGRQGLVKLNSGSVSSAATLDIVMTSYTAWMNKKLVLTSFVPATDGVGLTMRVSTNGGSSYDSGVADYAYLAAGAILGIGASDLASTGSSSFFTNAVVGNVAAEGCNMEIDLFDTTNTARWTQYNFAGSFRDTGGNFGRTQGAGARATAQDTDALRILFSSGNIASGTWVLYGYN